MWREYDRDINCTLGRNWTALKHEREETRKERQSRPVINDSSAARDDLASSSYAADLGLMSCNKTQPSTPEIGPLAAMLGSCLPH